MAQYTAEKLHVYLGGASLPTGLHGELSAYLGENLRGLSYNGRSALIIHTTADLTVEQEASARDIISAHNPIMMAAGRVGDIVTAVAWMPYSSLDSATFTVNGEALPSATTFGPHQQSGYTGVEVFRQAAQIRVGVSAYPTKEVYI